MSVSAEYVVLDSLAPSAFTFAQHTIDLYEMPLALQHISISHADETSMYRLTSTYKAESSERILSATGAVARRKRKIEQRTRPTISSTELITG